MRRLPALHPGRIRSLHLLLAAGVVFACGDPPSGNTGVHHIELWAPATQLRPGSVVQASASVFDATGHVVEGRSVTWRSLTPKTLAVSEDGLMEALAPGQGVARASIGSVTAQLAFALVNPPVAFLGTDVDTLRLSLPGGAREIQVQATDSGGLVIVAPAVTWQSTAPRIATVSATGRVEAIAVGHARVFVRGDERQAAVEVLVDAPPSATSPVISGIAPVMALPGQQLVVNGSGFGATIGANTVMIDGTPIPLAAASPTQLVLALPAASAFACEPTRVVALQVGTSGGIGVAPVTLQVATTRTLTPGQSLVFTSATDARCNEFTPATGRYLVTVPNAARALGAGPMALTVHGVSSPSVGALLLAPTFVRAQAARAEAAAAPRSTVAGLTERERSRASAHLRLLDANYDMLRVARPRSALRRAPSVATLQSLLPGTVRSVRIPNLGEPGFCDAYAAIGARVVFAGSHVVLLEDTASTFGGQPTLAGQMDDDYVALGHEIETVSWPLLLAFGNPLVMDHRLDDNGRVVLVFSPRINQKLRGGVLAAVVNCDFFSRAQFASSNVGEYLYAQVPISAASDFGDGTRARWRHEIRSALVHEIKHVTSYAERIVRGQPLEESWLEEATARHAEEMFARAVFGTQRYGNHGFDATLACELHAGDPAVPSCLGAPRAMRLHFDALWSYLDASEALSPLGPSAPGDFSFYGSGWALTRWLLDQQGSTEPVFFTALTTSGQSGIANLEGRTGRAWDEMLPEWSLAMVTDDLGGLTTASPRLRFPSWNLPVIFQGLCDALGPCLGPAASALYPRAYPLRPAVLGPGDVSLELASVVPGGFAVFELAVGPGTRSQLIELKGYRGGALPTTVRMGIVRVE